MRVGSVSFELDCDDHERLALEYGPLGGRVPAWLELLVLATASMFWPTLIAIVVLALRISHPVKILVWFMAGGLLTTRAARYP